MQEVDGLKPSKYLYELSEQNIDGKLPIQTVKEKLSEYYKETTDKECAETMECDVVSARIVELLAIGTVSLTSVALKSIHRYLFEGIYDFAGQFRQYNITKNESVLHSLVPFFMSKSKKRNYHISCLLLGVIYILLASDMKVRQ